MNTDADRLLEKYRGADSDDPGASVEFLQALHESSPDWTKYPSLVGSASVLSKLQLSGKTADNKAVLLSSGTLEACLEALKLADAKPVQYLLTLLYDMVREDGSCFAIYDAAIGGGLRVDSAFMDLMERTSDTYTFDKATWLLTSLMGHLPGHFTNSQVSGVVATLMKKKMGGQSSELGSLEAITNLLKADAFRKLVWEHQNVADTVFRVGPSASSPVLYRAVFALWTLSFDKDITASLKSYAVVQKIKNILMVSRVEKVVRLSLTVLKNFLASKTLGEDIAEQGVLEVVSQLEYEKWRDAELYDDIRDVANLIASEVKELSNFERYERELESGKLSWGFIHSTKFWAENAMKFEQQEFKALKLLAEMLSKSQDPMTLAVACHDLGEFVTLHPLGKKKVAQLGVKERVMELMSSTDQAYREVRREALLCCQKIMLNKWQDIQEKSK
mmetsp:Transcript_13147/g.24239  ORF Transcript_13147/g.24239 Transcript_13147/m.24239 type:complete len:446 (+) Transcript_13147:98-1435(+)